MTSYSVMFHLTVFLMWVVLFFRQFSNHIPNSGLIFLVYISVNVKNLVTMSKVTFLLRLSIYLSQPFAHQLKTSAGLSSHSWSPCLPIFVPVR